MHRHTKYIQKAKVLLRVLRLTLPYRSSIALLFVVMLLGTCLGLIGPYMSKLFIDVVFKPNTLTGAFDHAALLGVGVGILFGAQAIQQLAAFFRTRFSARLGNVMLHNLRSEMFGKLQALSLSFFDKQQTGALMSRVNQDTAELQRFMVDFCPVTLESTLMLAGSAVFLLLFNWQLTVIVAAPLAVISLFLRKIYWKIGTFFREYYERRSQLSARVGDALSGIRVVKIFGAEELETAKFNAISGAYRDAGITLARQTSVFSPAFSLVLILASCVVWFAGGELVLLKKMTLGSIIAFLGYLAMFYRPIMTLGQLLGGVAGPLSAAQRVFEIIDTKPEIREAQAPIAVTGLSGAIELRDVCFAYGEKQVLNGCCCRIEPGSMNAFVGRSGAGKSTVANVLCRLYDVSSGAVLIDGIDIRKLRIGDIRTHIGMVSQETFLFNATIVENIAYAKPSAGREEIIAVAKIACAHEFIVDKPQGYDTLVGERGVALSGGEKQRVAVARALLMRPAVLILDEATAAVDTVTENAVLSSLMHSGRVQTLICIAHRLASPRQFTRLFVMDHGKIIETGTHDQLLAAKGSYHELCLHKEIFSGSVT